MVTLARGEFDLLYRKLNGLENAIADLRRELRRSTNGRTTHLEHDPALMDPSMRAENGDSDQRHTDLHGIHTRNDAVGVRRSHQAIPLTGSKGEIVHLGGSSIPAMLFALGQGNTADHPEIREMLGKTVLPLFGLDNESATYPFVDLWGLPHGSLQRAQELAKALPVDSQMLTLFRYYRDMGHVIFPGVADLQQLESDLTVFLINRAAQMGSEDGVNEQSIYGKNYHWLGLLFAVLASGAQCSPLPRKERELTSQVYICCAFECLRFTNFISQANLESIQTLLVIQNVLTNNMNAGSAWSLMGLTIRLAQNLGVHQACPPATPEDRTFPRSKIWWAVVWQDSLLSISYDRASSTLSVDRNTMPMPQHFRAVPHYHASMYRLCRVGLDIVQDRTLSLQPRELHDRIVQHRDAISSIMRDAAEYLRDSRKCTSPQETLEHWGLYLHTSYALSELCRPAISPSTADRELARAFKPLCIDNLVNTVEAFLGLNNITQYARQSWASVHRGLGSALLLGILGEHTRNDRARRLLGRFIAVMQDITTNIDPQEISLPVQRGVEALRKLNIQDTRSSSFTGNTMGGASNDNGMLGADGSLKLEHSSILATPTSDTAYGAPEEYSPYSVLNSILWGNNDTRPEDVPYH